MKIGKKNGMEKEGGSRICVKLMHDTGYTGIG